MPIARLLPCEVTDSRFELVGVLLIDDAQPERLEPPGAAVTADADALDGELLFGEAQRLALAGAAVTEAERDVDQQHVEPEEAADRPGADGDEDDADGNADQPEHQHQRVEPAQGQAAIGQQDALEKDPRRGNGDCGIGRIHHGSKIAQAARRYRGK